MSQKLSLGEFEKYYRSLLPKPSDYIFDTDNQDWCPIDNTLKIKFVFSSIAIHYSPNTIRFYSDGTNMLLQKIKYIKICEPSTLGGVFKIVCANTSGDFIDKSYTIIIR